MGSRDVNGSVVFCSYIYALLGFKFLFGDSAVQRRQKYCILAPHASLVLRD